MPVYSLSIKYLLTPSKGEWFKAHKHKRLRRPFKDGKLLSEKYKDDLLRRTYKFLYFKKAMTPGEIASSHRLCKLKIKYYLSCTIIPLETRSFGYSPMISGISFSEN